MIYLASQSPRRAELLQQLGIHFSQQAVHCDESLLPGERCDDYVVRLARAKAKRLYLDLQIADAIVLGADTAVMAQSEILGKPQDFSDFRRMMQLLSAATHYVATAVAIFHNGSVTTELSVSKVTFRALTEQEIDAYWNSGEPQDKAGGYAIQGRAAQFIAHLDGSYSGVMGLPLFETAQLLQNTGYPVWE